MKIRNPQPDIFVGNLIVNGNMDDWWKGTSFTNTGQTGPYFTANTWFGSQVGNGVDDEITSRVSIGNLEGSEYGLRIRQYKASGFDGGDSWLCQIIPKSRLLNHQGKTLTISFYHRMPSGTTPFSSSGYIGIRYSNSGNFSSADVSSTSPSSQGTGWVAVNGTSNFVQFRSGGDTTTTWTRFEGTVEVPDDAESLLIFVYLGNNTTNDAYIDFAQFYLHEGEVALPFQYFGGSRSADQYEQMKYIEKTYDFTVDPGSVNNNGAGIEMGVGDSSNTFWTTYNYKVPKHTAPTATLYSNATGTSGNVYRDTGSGYSDATGSTAYIGQNRLILGAGVTSGNQISIIYHLLLEANL